MDGCAYAGASSAYWQVALWSRPCAYSLPSPGVFFFLFVQVIKTAGVFYALLRFSGYSACKCVQIVNTEVTVIAIRCNVSNCWQTHPMYVLNILHVWFSCTMETANFYSYVLCITYVCIFLMKLTIQCSEVFLPVVTPLTVLSAESGVSIPEVFHFQSFFSFFHKSNTNSSLLYIQFGIPSIQFLNLFCCVLQDHRVQAGANPSSQWMRESVYTLQRSPVYS